MANVPDHHDHERYEMIDVPWSEVNDREPALIAAGWVRVTNAGLGFLEEDIAALFYVRERPGYIAPQNKIIECRDCHQSFTFTVEEQKFFKKKGFVDPKRCPDCRKKNKS